MKSAANESSQGFSLTTPVLAKYKIHFYKISPSTTNVFYFTSENDITLLVFGFIAVTNQDAIR